MHAEILTFLSNMYPIKPFSCFNQATPSTTLDFSGWKYGYDCCHGLGISVGEVSMPLWSNQKNGRTLNVFFFFGW